MIVHYLQKKTVYYEHLKNMFETFVLILDKVEHYIYLTIQRFIHNWLIFVSEHVILYFFIILIYSP